MPKPYYQDNACTIYHGDCRDILASLPKMDLILMDPPYGIKHASSRGATWQNTQIQGDLDCQIRDIVLEQTLGVPAIVFGSWKRPRPVHTRHILIWDKGPASGMGDLTFPWKLSFEEIYIIGNDIWCGSRDESVLHGHRVVTWQAGPAMNGRNGRQHPNAKPLSLMTYLISKTTAGTICDPFCGSGPVLRAAKDLGRKAIGIEIEEAYCSIAAKRLAQEVLPLNNS